MDGPNRRFKLPPTNYLLSLVAVALLIILGVVVANRHRSTPASPAGSAGAIAGRINTPDAWQPQPINEQEKNLGIDLKLRRDNPSASLVVQAIKGDLAQDFDINKLPEQIAVRYKKQKGLSIVSKGVVKVGRQATTQIDYRQNGNRYLLVVMPQAHQYFYLNFRASAADFPKVLPDFKTITSDFANYVSGLPV